MDTQKRTLVAFRQSKLFSSLATVTCSVLLAAALMGSAAAANERYTMTIYDEGTVSTIETAETNAIKVLKDNGYWVGKIDDVEVTVNGTQAAVYIRREFTVTINADGETTTVKMTKGTYKDALDKAGITVDSYDRINVSLEEQAVPDGTVFISRVTTEKYTITEEVPFETVEEESNTVYIGSEEVVADGEAGERIVTYVDILLDGELIETRVTGADVTKAPVDRKVLIGTKEIPKTAVQPAASVRDATVQNTDEEAEAANNTVINMISELALPAGLSLDENGVPVGYSSVITGRATAYVASSGARTSTGKTPMPGYIAVDPKKIPYGTKLWITSADGSVVYGYAIAADTGGDMRNGRFLCDLYMNSYGECMQWGVRNINMYVLP